MLEVVGEQTKGVVFPFQLSRNEAKYRRAVFPGSQRTVTPSEHGCRGDGTARIHNHHLGFHLPEERIDLVAAGQPEGGSAQEEEGHVGPQAASQRVQPIGAQADSPQPVERQQHGRRVAAPAAHPARDRYALGDDDFNTLAHARVLLQELGGAYGQVALAGRHAGMIAMRGDAALPRSQHDVVVQLDRLEQRAQLVVAVLSRTEHFEAEVDLRERADSQRGANGARAWRGRGHPHRVHRVRASSMSTAR